MNKFKFGLLAASALCASGFVALASPATARDRNDVNISISLGNAAIGYNDGYYDQNRDWHAWRDDDERAWYRSNHRQSYFEMNRSQDRDQYRGDWRDGRRSDWRNDRDGPDFSIVLNNIAFGYSDGYYDRDRSWHDWRNDDERRWYEQNRRQYYHEMRRRDDRDDRRIGWRDGRYNTWNDNGSVDFTIVLGDVAFGYSDGYYDQQRRWHNWRNDNERRWYQQNRRQYYHEMRRYDDRDARRVGWRNGRYNTWNGNGNVDFSISLGSVVFAYSDGYYDESRRWHKWRNTNERRWYQQNRRQTYHNMRRNQDRQRSRIDWREGRQQDWRDRRDRR